MPRGGGVKIFSASRADLWRYAGWTAVAIAVVLYYGRYSKTPVNLVVYALGAECLWNGQPFHQCAPEFTYPPAVAFLMLPFVPLVAGAAAARLVCDLDRRDDRLRGFVRSARAQALSGGRG